MTEGVFKWAAEDSDRCEPVDAVFKRTMLVRGGDIGVGHHAVVVDLDLDGGLEVVLPGKSGLHLLRRR